MKSRDLLKDTLVQIYSSQTSLVIELLANFWQCTTNTFTLKKRRNPVTRTKVVNTKGPGPLTKMHDIRVNFFNEPEDLRAEVISLMMNFDIDSSHYPFLTHNVRVD